MNARRRRPKIGTFSKSRATSLIRFYAFLAAETMTLQRIVMKPTRERHCRPDKHSPTPYRAADESRRAAMLTVAPMMLLTATFF